MRSQTGIVKAIRYQKNENKPLCQQISGRLGQIITYKNQIKLFYFPDLGKDIYNSPHHLLE